MKKLNSIVFILMSFSVLFFCGCSDSQVSSEVALSSEREHKLTCVLGDNPCL